MTLLGAYVFPHPPIIIPEIGRGEEVEAQNTIIGVNKLAEDIAQKEPATIIVITPHGPVFDDAVCISTEEKLYGDFKRFGNSKLNFEFNNNSDLTDKIITSANLEGILVGELNKSFARQYNISTDIDHGTLVPLYFVNKRYTNYKLIHISMGLLPYQDLYKFGMSINNIIKEVEEKVVVIASGDLSHRLLKTAPAGYHPRGKEFDEKLISLIKQNDVESILNLDNELVECAGECGLRPIIILYGILDGYNIKPEVVSYEGPFGVGYATVKYDILGQSNTSIYQKIVENNIKKIEDIRSKEDEYVTLARTTLEKYVKDGIIIDVPKNISKELLENRAGVFVSIKKHGKLRGCIGTISPTRKNIAEEIIHNAISAGTRDPRFFPVEEDELDDLVYSVDVLKEPEPVKSKDELDVKKYGIIVRKGSRTGVLLPNLEGVDTVEQQIQIALSKAGIAEYENYTMERFEVVRHGTK